MFRMYSILHSSSTNRFLLLDYLDRKSTYIAFTSTIAAVCTVTGILTTTTITSKTTTTTGTGTGPGTKPYVVQCDQHEHQHHYQHHYQQHHQQHPIVVTTTATDVITLQRETHNDDSIIIQGNNEISTSNQYNIRNNDNNNKNGTITRTDSSTNITIIQDPEQSIIEDSRLIFLGTGSSTGCPRPLCTLMFPNGIPSIHPTSTGPADSTIAISMEQQHYLPFCKTSIAANSYSTTISAAARKNSSIATSGDNAPTNNNTTNSDNPRYNKNYRNNPSMVISLVVTNGKKSDDTTTTTTTTTSTTSTTTTSNVIKPIKTEEGTSNAETDTRAISKSSVSSPESSSESTSLPLSQPQTQTYNIVIDTGKTFREAALRWLPVHNIRSIDAIVLTHEHMDACGGLDDVRGFQKWKFTSSGSSKDDESISTTSASSLSSLSSCSKSTNNIIHDNNEDINNNSKLRKRQPKQAVPMPLFLSKQCHDKIQNQFPWLIPPKKMDNVKNEVQNSCCSDTSSGIDAIRTSSTSTGSGTEPVVPIIKRHVATFDVTIMEPYQEIEIIPNGIFSIIPLPVMHGEDFVSNGYAFSVPNVGGVDYDNNNNNNNNNTTNGCAETTKTKTTTTTMTNVLYLSDISRMIPETMSFIENNLPVTNVLIVDTLNFYETNPTHYNLMDAIEFSRQIQKMNDTKEKKKNNDTNSRKKTTENNTSLPNNNNNNNHKNFIVYLVGMNCDDFTLHDEMNHYLYTTYGGGGSSSRTGRSAAGDCSSTTVTSTENSDDDDYHHYHPLDIQLAHDGLSISFLPKEK